ncbi:MAG: glycosyltransferase [Actinobacteria bacterium]|nr:glycosyltransferase [Actinomycetota bacterium]
MKVLQINKLYYPHVGGVENHVRSLSVGLKDRADVRVLCANDGPRIAHDVVDGIEVTRLPNLYAGLSAPVAPAFLRRLPDGACDIQHLHFPSGFPEIALANAGRKVAKAIVVTYHSDIVRQKRLGRLFQPFAEKLLARADRIIVGSPNLIYNSRLLGQVKAVKDKCVVIPFGVDPKAFEVTDQVARKVEGIKATYGDRLVFFLGRLIYYKGVDHLIRAMTEVKGMLLVGGTGPLEGKLKALAQEIGVADKVVFLGSITEDERSAYYRACDVFVLPSVEPSEAYGLAQVEAHMCGKPVVSTRLPTGVPFVNRDGVTGFVVPPADDKALARALNNLLDDEGLRLEMGERARERALAEFTIDRMVDRTIEVYSDVLSGRRPQWARGLSQ